MDVNLFGAEFTEKELPEDTRVQEYVAKRFQQMHPWQKREMRRRQQEAAKNDIALQLENAINKTE